MIMSWVKKILGSAKVHTSQGTGISVGLVADVSRRLVNGPEFQLQLDTFFQYILLPEINNRIQFSMLS